MAIIRFALCGALLWGSTALAHDHWISRENLSDPVTKQSCCDKDDCQEEFTVRRADASGYLIMSTGEIWGRDRVIWKSPGGWWRCKWIATGLTRCLIGPPNSG
jgi:hypothetical protein